MAQETPVEAIQEITEAAIPETVQEPEMIQAEPPMEVRETTVPEEAVVTDQVTVLLYQTTIS